MRGTGCLFTTDTKPAAARELFRFPFLPKDEVSRPIPAIHDPAVLPADDLHTGCRMLAPLHQRTPTRCSHLTIRWWIRRWIGAHSPLLSHAILVSIGDPVVCSLLPTKILINSTINQNNTVPSDLLLLLAYQRIHQNIATIVHPHAAVQDLT